MNLDQVWFGAILAKLLEDGSFTPYIGLNIFASESVVGQSLPLAAIIRRVIYFISHDAIIVILLSSFTKIALLLPCLLNGTKAKGQSHENSR